MTSDDLMIENAVVDNKADLLVDDSVRRENNDIVISVKNLYKKYCTNLKRSMFYGILDLSKNLLGIKHDTSFLKKDEFWALDNISFELKKGEVLGIIGANGSGKTTLLRILNGIFPPDKGTVTVKGRIGALIALGAGFHPHMTGRENIYLNGIILGMTKREINDKFQSIIDFAEIGDFINAPVSTYSSGMKVRLGFGIAIHCEPDIMLIDEVLAVGDVSFRNKALRKMAELRRKAKAIIFISHNMDTTRGICDRIILIHNGKIICEGDPDEVVAEYLELSREISLKSDEKELEKEVREVGTKLLTDQITFLEAGVLDKNGSVTKTIQMGEDIKIFYDFIPNTNMNKPIVIVGFRNSKNDNIVLESNFYNTKDINIPSFKEKTKYRISVIYKNPNIIPGVYRLNLGIKNSETLELYQKIRMDNDAEFIVEPVDVANFKVDRKKVYPPGDPVIELESQWRCEEVN